MSSKRSSLPKKIETDKLPTETQLELEDEPEYEVESVLAKKVVDGHVFYQIKWKG